MIRKMIIGTLVVMGFLYPMSWAFTRPEWYGGATVFATMLAMAVTVVVTAISINRDLTGY